jgi:hypothetical protein
VQAERSNVKLSFLQYPVHTIKAWGGKRINPLTLNFGGRQMDNQHQAPADLTPVPISEGCVGPRAGLEKRKISPARIRTLRRPVLSLITTTTELSWIYCNILAFSGRTSPLAVHQKSGGPTKFCSSGPRMDISSTVTRSVAWTLVSADYCQHCNTFFRLAGDPLRDLSHLAPLPVGM